MTKVIVAPENIEFTVEANENILSAGLRNGLNLPHGCKNGACGACKCKLESGDVSLDEYKVSVLSDEERHQGYTLLCKAHATTDVVLHIPHLLTGYPIKMFPAKVDKIEKTSNAAIITLKIPASQKFGFYAGQYVDIMLNGKNRSYSVANSPTQEGEVELHVRYHAGGVFSEFVWNELKLQQMLRFKGPLGNFRLQETEAPVVLVCTGTGFAPIKAILEYMLATNSKREIHFYWGNRTLSDFYLLNLLPEWLSGLNLKITLCLSKEHLSDYFSGYVTEALARDNLNLAKYEVYACGNLLMIEDVYNLTTDKLHLDRKNFFSDAFTPSVG